MKSLLLALLLLISTACKAVAAEPSWLADAKTYTYAVSSRYSFGHICPVSATTALTAEHVSSRPFAGNSLNHRITPLMWEGGSLLEIISDTRRDISVVQSDNEFPKFFKIADKPPAIGSPVWVIAFEYSTGLLPKPIKTKVLSVVGAHLFYDRGAGPGSSGSCVFNENGEVVAINVLGFEVDEKKWIGGGVLVTGTFIPIPKPFAESRE